VVLDGKGLGLETGRDVHDGGGDGGDEGLVEGAEEVEGGDVEDFGSAMYRGGMLMVCEDSGRGGGRETNPPMRITPTCRIRPGLERLIGLDMAESCDLR
jgi:hypothetical protein